MADPNQSANHLVRVQLQSCSIDEELPNNSLTNSDNQNMTQCLRVLKKSILQKSLKYFLGLNGIEPKDDSNKSADNDSTTSSIVLSGSSLESLRQFMYKDKKLHHQNFIQLSGIEQDQNNSDFVELKDKLNKAFFCQFDTCSDEECLAGKKLVKMLVENIQNRHLDIESKYTLHILLEHCLECKEIACKVIGCMQFSGSSEKGHNELMECIYSNEEFLQIDNSTKFYEFTKSNEFKSAIDVKNCTVVKVKQLPICGVSNLMNINGKYVIVTKCQNAQHNVNYMTESLAVINAIGSLQYQYIIPINWIIINKNEFYFCSKYYFEPLQKKINNLKGSKIKDIILKLIEAAKYLNNNGILFLAWTSNNLLLNERDIPQLTNFHLGASLMSQINLETTKNLVFPTILPPEFRFQYENYGKADVWGICCLLKELISKVVVHHDLIHLPREMVWNEMIKRGWQCKSPSAVKYILYHGWNLKPDGRLDLEELEKIIKKRYRTD
ncbi:uncharacterized protein LOC115215143 [Argonauta hians]